MMETLKTVLQSAPLLVMIVWMKYRFAYQALGVKISKALTLCIMLTVHMLAGGLNVRFVLAGTIGENALYDGIATLLLYLLLFRGDIVKKLFLTVLICCGMPISYYILLPFVSCFLGHAPAKFLLSLHVLDYINSAFVVVVMEYVGRRFQNLRRDLPTGYTIYLTAVILFVQVAVYAGYEGMLVKNDGVVSLPAALATSAFAVAGMAIVLVAIFAVDRQVERSLKEQLQLVQAENLKSRELEWRRLSSFRHDIKNHLLCLNSLLENGKTEQAASYMLHLTDTARQLDSPVLTGNDYADALLSVKYAQALEASIKVSLDMAIPAQGLVDPVDLCCILSNAFDNAIAACKNLPVDERWMVARAFTKQGQLVIAIQNSKPAYVTVTAGEVFPKELTADHGIGLSTVKTVVEKYGGTLHLLADDAFCFSVLLPQRRL